MNKQVSEYMADIGSKGGASGTGAAKRRGDAEFYRNLVRIREEKRAKARANAKKL